MKFLGWAALVGSAMRSALDLRNEQERQMDQRPVLDDESFYARYYDGTEVPRDIPIRARRILAEQLGAHWLRVCPSDDIPAILMDVDLTNIIWEIAEEFDVEVTLDQMKGIDGTFDSVVRCFANLRKLNQSAGPLTSPRRWFRFGLRTMLVGVGASGLTL